MTIRIRYTLSTFHKHLRKNFYYSRISLSDPRSTLFQGVSIPLPERVGLTHTHILPIEKPDVKGPLNFF